MPRAAPPPSSVLPGQTEGIEYEDERGKWHRELSPGSDRPDTDVEDTA